MKRYIITLLVLLAMGTPIIKAQEADTVAINRFLHELKKLDGRGVTYEIITQERLQSILVEQVNEQTDNLLGSLEGAKYLRQRVYDDKMQLGQQGGIQ